MGANEASPRMYLKIPAASETRRELASEDQAMLVGEASVEQLAGTEDGPRLRVGWSMTTTTSLVATASIGGKAAKGIGAGSYTRLRKQPGRRY